MRKILLVLFMLVGFLGCVKDEKEWSIYEKHCTYDIVSKNGVVEPKSNIIVIYNDKFIESVVGVESSIEHLCKSKYKATVTRSTPAPFTTVDHYDEYSYTYTRW